MREGGWEGGREGRRKEGSEGKEGLIVTLLHLCGTSYSTSLHEGGREGGREGENLRKGGSEGD